MMAEMEIPGLENLTPWEAMLKRITFSQLGAIKDRKILDFGSGTGFTANYFAKNNEVVAVEPSKEAVKDRICGNPYQQLLGSAEKLQKLKDASFDWIFCHNVLEYAEEREKIVPEFYRLLKPEGKLSVIKHNRSGRVMQTAVLLNDFEKAQELLDGKNSAASKFGTIRYYEDTDLTDWCRGFELAETYGIRTFWDLQQNQEFHKDADWQEKMVKLELKAAQREEFRAIAFFHHLILTKIDC